MLISAYACEPDKGSEPGVGWNWVVQMARFHELWVITRATNRALIEKSLAKEPLPNVHWVYLDLPRWARFWKKGRRGVHLYYCLWQLGAYFRARKLHQQVGLDLVHHVTFVNYWMPSFLALLPVPFVWGPVGGGESAPRSFWRGLTLRGKVYEGLRDLGRSSGRLDPFVRLAAQRAALGLATTPQTEKRLRALGSRQVLVFAEAGMPRRDIEELGALPIRERGRLRFLSLGRLVHFKGFELSLRAFARFARRCPASEYWIVGDGPERRRLEKLAQNLGLTGKVRFWGMIARSEALGKLADCDVLVHPSLHDSGGWVCLEAMAAGRPVICLDLGGPAFQVTEQTGIKVPANTPEQAVAELANSMLRLAEDPELRVRMGEASRQRVKRDFEWGKKGELMHQIYGGIVTQAGDEAC